mgnify:FL=1
MAITIVRKPQKKFGPVGQDWLYSLQSTNVSQPKFKFVIDVKMHQSVSPGAVDVRLKISPDTLGIGNFNLRDILEQYVSSDNTAKLSAPHSTFRGQQIIFADGFELPVHLIQQYTQSNYALSHFTLEFGEEYASSTTGPTTVYNNLLSDADNTVFNGVAPNRSQKYYYNSGSDAGYAVDIQDNNASTVGSIYGGPYVAHTGSANAKFITNAPTNQYCRAGDFMTVAIFTGFINGVAAAWDRISIEFPNGNKYEAPCNATFNGRDGSGDGAIQPIGRHWHYFGIGPGNQTGITDFDNNYGLNDYYDFALYNGTNAVAGNRTSQYYRINKMEDDCKGYETIRLCWLNRHGAWDYYNFTKKSFREIDIEKEYLQHDNINYALGVKKHNYFRTNSVYNTTAKERITANTDWVDDEHAIWLEELFTSPEVYMLGQFNTNDLGTDSYMLDLNYVTPVIITNNKYERYTSANDKVAQYEIEIEVDNTVNVQKNQRGLQKL